MPEPGGLTVVEAAAALRRVADETPLAGAAAHGADPAPDNVAPLLRLTQALGL